MKQDRVIEQAPQPMLFGEVLYDSFPDGSVVLGGAPFNVAWHLQGFGLAPVLISRVGDDELGERILSAMSEWGMDMRGMQRDPIHATGRVMVSFKGNEPNFEIVPEQAYDFIDADSAAEILRGGRYALLYHGSLIARHAASRTALDRLRKAHLPLFVDVNLRDPWWEQRWLVDALRGARWAKLNEQELRVLSKKKDGPNPPLQDQAQTLRKECGLKVLVVTRGAAGVLVLSDTTIEETAPGNVGEVVDTVGAGDAFSAVMILGLLRGWPLPLLAERAVDFAAAVCRMRGATGSDRGLYRAFWRKWGK